MKNQIVEKLCRDLAQSNERLGELIRIEMKWRNMTPEQFEDYCKPGPGEEHHLRWNRPHSLESERRLTQKQSEQYAEWMHDAKEIVSMWDARRGAGL